MEKSNGVISGGSVLHGRDSWYAGGIAIVKKKGRDGVGPVSQEEAKAMDGVCR